MILLYDRINNFLLGPINVFINNAVTIRLDGDYFFVPGFNVLIQQVDAALDYYGILI